MDSCEQFPNVYDLEIISVRPNGPIISFKAEMAVPNETEFFIHPKCVEMHATDTSFSVFAREEELIPLTADKMEYTLKVTTLKSNKHYSLQLDLYAMNEMFEEYEVLSSFETPFALQLTFATQDQYYWISCAECRYYAGLATYNKIDDAVFRFIASFCAEFSFYGMSDSIVITDNGVTVNVKRLFDAEISVLFGDFLYAKDERKFRVVFELVQVSRKQIRFGFVTHEFEPESPDNDKNHKMDVESAQFVSGNCVTVVVDMKAQIGAVYMSNNEKYPLFKVKLSEYIAIVISFEASALYEQRITVKECGFVI